MGFITQFQRRAIEEVFSRFDLVATASDNYLLEGQILNLLGISPGEGTCSDLHGINIAVLSREFPFNPKFHWAIKFPMTCQGAILLRSPSEIEIENALKLQPKGSNIPLCVVEGLDILRNSSQLKVFKSNGKSKTYVTLV